MTNGAKVVVGMSGGVDSSVAAYLLLKAGYEVLGLFMKNWEEDDGTEYCTAKEDHADAAKVCDKLGIELTTANFAAEYWDNVFDEFLTSYRAGHTPNPDVLCNREIKFKHFADYARSLGADFIATGHYAQCDLSGNRPRLLKARDEGKDQTYFLQAVPSEALQDCLFPLGNMLKSEVRALAAEVGLHNHERKDSTGICFIGERRFADFLKRYIAGNTGNIVDPQGRILGEHAGLHNFTIGQRQGLQLGGMADRPEAPWYVVGKESLSNNLIVSQDSQELCGNWLRCTEPNWLEDAIPTKLQTQGHLPLQCKIRYRQPDQACTVKPAADGSYLVDFAQPQRAIALGQYVAFYDQDQLVGGARISNAAQPLLQRTTYQN